MITTVLIQAIGLALSLRRLDDIEMIYVSSRAPGASSSSHVIHDESLLRYILSEVVSGASGNETSDAEFRRDVSFSIVVQANLIENSYSTSSSACSTSTLRLIGPA